MERGAKTVVSCLGRTRRSPPRVEPNLPGGHRASLPRARAPEGRCFDVILTHDASSLITAGGTERFRELPGCGRPPSGRGAERAGADLIGPVPTGGPGYSELVAQLSQSFLSVQVVVQSPLLGYTLVPYGVENPDTAVDGTLAGAVQPSHYLLLCGQEPLVFDELRLVALAGAAAARRARPAAGDHPGDERKSSSPPSCSTLEDTAQQLREALAAAEAARAERDSWVAGLRHEVEERDTTLTWREQEARASAPTRLRRARRPTPTARTGTTRGGSSRARRGVGRRALPRQVREADLRQARGELEQLERPRGGEAGRARRKPGRAALSAAERLEQEAARCGPRWCARGRPARGTAFGSTRDSARDGRPHWTCPGREATRRRGARRKEEVGALETSRRALTAEWPAEDRIAQLPRARRPTRHRRPAHRGRGRSGHRRQRAGASEAQLTTARLAARARGSAGGVGGAGARARMLADGLRQELAEARARAEQWRPGGVSRASEVPAEPGRRERRGQPALDDAAVAAERAGELERHSRRAAPGPLASSGISRPWPAPNLKAGLARKPPRPRGPPRPRPWANSSKPSRLRAPRMSDCGGRPRSATPRHGATPRPWRRPEAILEKTNETLAAERRTTREAVDKLGRIEELAQGRAGAGRDHAETEALLREANPRAGPGAGRHDTERGAPRGCRATGRDRRARGRGTAQVLDGGRAVRGAGGR